MARHFVDTSALVKLYRHEPLTTAVQACLAPNDTLVLSGIASLEFQSAFYGLVRDNSARSWDVPTFNCPALRESGQEPWPVCTARAPKYGSPASQLSGESS